MNNFYATQNQTTNCKTTGNTFSLKFRTQWLAMTFAFFALLAGSFSQASATCDNVTNGGTIAADQSNCGSFDPTAFTSVSAPSGGSGALEIVWITRTWNGSSDRKSVV